MNSNPIENKTSEYFASKLVEESSTKGFDEVLYGSQKEKRSEVTKAIETLTTFFEDRRKPLDLSIHTFEKREKAMGSVVEAKNTWERMNGRGARALLWVLSFFGLSPKAKLMRKIDGLQGALLQHYKVHKNLLKHDIQEVKTSKEVKTLFLFMECFSKRETIRGHGEVAFILTLFSSIFYTRDNFATVDDYYRYQEHWDLMNIAIAKKYFLENPEKAKEVFNQVLAKLPQKLKSEGADHLCQGPEFIDFVIWLHDQGVETGPIVEKLYQTAQPTPFRDYYLSERVNSIQKLMDNGFPIPEKFDPRPLLDISKPPQERLDLFHAKKVFDKMLPQQKMTVLEHLYKQSSGEKETAWVFHETYKPTLIEYVEAIIKDDQLLEEWGDPKEVDTSEA